jgi:hypothetical protein
MLRQVLDAVGQQADLDLGGPGIRIMDLELGNQIAFVLR